MIIWMLYAIILVSLYALIIMQVLKGSLVCVGDFTNS